MSSIDFLESRDSIILNQKIYRVILRYYYVFEYLLIVIVPVYKNYTC